LDTETILTLIAIGGTISGIILGWAGRTRNIKHDVAGDASKDAELRTNMEYIKRGIDDVRVEQKVQGQRFDQLSERVTRVEESTKSAHRRLDRFESAKGE
jgi:hypothetical protein